MNNKKAVFSTLCCIFIAALFILGCNNHLLKPQQDEPHLLVRIVNSTGARNATTTGEWQISAWIENRDGTKSHQQNVTSASGSDASITFEELVIGSQINIHLELTKNDDNQTKLTGESDWITVKEGVNVIVIVLREDNGSSHAQIPVIEEISSTIKTYTSNPQPVTTTLEAVASVTDGGALTYQWYSSDSPTTDSGTAIEDATSATYDARVEAGKTKYFYCVVTNTNNNVNGNKTASATSNIATVASIEGTLTGITAHYTGGTHELVNEDITYSNIEIVQEYAIPNAEPQEISVVASSVSTQYTIELQDDNAIGNVPATVTHKTNPQITADFTIPVKYQLDVNKLTLNGSNSVEQNGSLSLTATYADTYTKYDGGSGSEYNVKNNVTVTWTGATPQSDDAWTATADTQTTGQNTATVKLTSTDMAWCVTTNGITKSHSYEVTAPAPSYDPTVGLSWADSTLTIYNEQGLKNFRDIVNGTLTQSIEVDGKTFSGQDRTVNARLAADIELTEDWTPIANNSTNPYAGTFDGAGHTVSEINVTGGSNPKGFFGSIGTNKAIIKNLTVEGTVDVSYYAGGIAGYVDGGTIEYCVNKINVTSTTTTGTGGIAGYIAGSGATITGCVNFGEIKSYGYVGGIVGGNYYTNSTGAKIDKCINLGTITAENGSSLNAGGIYGYAALTSDAITNCANFGNIVSSGRGAGITNNDDGNNSVKYSLNVGDMSGVTSSNKRYAVASNTSGSYTGNYYDSSKITGATTTGGTGKATSALKVASASSLDSSWSTNWSFASGRYPLPNIQNNIPSEIWTEIENSAK